MPLFEAKPLASWPRPEATRAQIDPFWSQALARALGIDFRVVPIERSVESQNTVLDADSARKIFRDAELITALPCACRVQAQKNNRSPDCPAPASSVCMQTNGFAEVVLSRGLGERLTNEEALKRVDEAEEAGG